MVPSLTIKPGASFSISSVATPPLPITTSAFILTCGANSGTANSCATGLGSNATGYLPTASANSTSCLLSLRYFMNTSYFRANALSLAFISLPAGICGICLIFTSSFEVLSHQKFPTLVTAAAEKRRKSKRKCKSSFFSSGETGILMLEKNFDLFSFVLIKDRSIVISLFSYSASQF